MEEIGRRLRQKRLEKKLTIEKVNSRTRIPVKFIGALEEGDYSQFSAEVYYTGSLRKYARFLGLDENELMSIYRGHAEKIRAVLAPPHKTSFWERPDVKKSIALILAAVILIAVGIMVVARLDRPQTAQGDVMQQAQAAATMPDTSTRSPGVPPAAPLKRSEPGSVTGAASTGSMAISSASGSLMAPERVKRDPRPGDLVLEIRTTKDSWLRVTAGNERVFEGIMTAGGRRRWTTDGRYDIIVGYVPGVEMTLNGRPVNILQGAVKDVNQITLTCDTPEGIY